MFNIGDLIIGNESNYYVYTNDKSLCIIAKLASNNQAYVFVLEGNYINNTSNTDAEGIINRGFQDEEAAYYLVDCAKFNPITFEEWEQFKADNSSIVFHRNVNYNAIVKIFGKEGNMTMTETTTEPVINLKGTYKFTETQKNYALSHMEQIMTKYGHENTQKGLEKIWETFKTNKSGLAHLLSMHPNWDENVMGIVLENSYSRVKDNDTVEEFCHWCKKQLKKWASKRQYKINCCTVDEIEASKRKLGEIKKRMEYLAGIFGRDHRVTFDGMTYEEICEEYNRIIELYRKAYNNSEYVEYGVYVNKDAYKKYINGVYFVKLVLNYNSHIADEEFAEKANEYASPFNYVKNGKTIGLGAVKGQKISRIVGKFFKSYDFDKIVDMQTDTWYDTNGNFHSRERDYGWNKKFAEFADAINPLEVKRWTIISVNPVDYITMSFGNGWASCHTPDKKNERGADGNYSGCYCSGTLSYMLDNCTLIMYTVSEKYKGKDFCLEDKMNRCNFHIGEDKFVQGRLYPDGRNADAETSMAGQFRTVMQRVLTECVNETNLWKVLKGTSNCDRYTRCGISSTNYRDWLHYDDCNVSLLKRNGVEENATRITIGHAPICPCCGKEHSDEEWLACGRCRDGYEDGNYVECYACGEEINLDRDDYVYDEDREVYFCDSDCASNYDCYYCTNVNEYHSEWVFEDNYTGKHFYDYCENNCVHIHDDYHYINVENAENDGWALIDGEWYNTDDTNVIECPHCGGWTLADHDECLQCGALINDEDLIDDIDEAM